jgi:FKBP-type peptidyl-prolyl cis-trans isomerase SlyD
MSKNNMKSESSKSSSPEDALMITYKHWVRVKYRLFSFQGEALEDNFRELTYLHGGYGDVLPKIEEALTGHFPGYVTSLHLEPDDAFGEYDADLMNQISRDELPMDIEVGMSIEGLPGTVNDGVIYNVTDLTDTVAIVDGNHPLAGLGVRFDIEVLEVHPASEDEIATHLAADGPTDDWHLQQTAPGSDAQH